MPLTTVQEILEVFRALAAVTEGNKKWAFSQAEDVLWPMLENLRQIQRPEVEAVDIEVSRLRQQIAAKGRSAGGQP